MRRASATAAVTDSSVAAFSRRSSRRYRQPLTAATPLPAATTSTPTQSVTPATTYGSPSSTGTTGSSA